MKIIIFISFLTACSSNADKTINSNTNFSDTIVKTYVLSVENGDTQKRVQKVYFSPTDISVSPSGFSFEAWNHPYEKDKMYKIYFQREKVVSFCDSMINALAAVNDRYFESPTYVEIKEQAIANKSQHISVGQLAILLERFNPLIINEASGDKPQYVIVEVDRQPTVEYKDYKLKTYWGDTIYLDRLIGKEEETKPGENE